MMHTHTHTYTHTHTHTQTKTHTHTGESTSVQNSSPETITMYKAWASICAAEQMHYAAWLSETNKAYGLHYYSPQLWNTPTDWGPSEGWAFRRLGLQKAGPSDGWAFRRLGLQKAGPSEGWACRRLGLQKTGPAEGWACRSRNQSPLH